MMLAINGNDGHDDKTSIEAPPIEEKPTPMPEAERIKLCCERLGHGSWCNLPDGHEGDHEGAAPEYGPLEERPSLWRRHRGHK